MHRVFEIRPPFLQKNIKLSGYLFVFLFTTAFFLSSCQSLDEKRLLAVNIVVDGKSIPVQVSAGASVKTALDTAGIVSGPLDRVSPSLDTLLTSIQEIKVTRVAEEFEVVENVVSFERQTVKNESLPEGQTLLIQTGENGLQQITYRKLLEDGNLVSRSVFKTVDLTPARPEIVMIGVQAPFSSVPIPGKIAYLSGGNAWLMDGSTGYRTPLVNTGDLDGRIFALSPKADWLLFSRKRIEDPKEVINSLWIIKTGDSEARPINLGIQNVVHHAAWVPDPNLLITYSTVEPRSTAPGWQANNDLQLIYLTANGEISVHNELVEANSGGIYGWWGTSYSWSPFGDITAFSQPDRIGVINPDDGSFITLKQITPLQTRSDWAWVPAVTWSRDQVVYTVDHPASPAAAIAEQSPQFDLVAILPGNDHPVDLVPNAGMFSSAFPSPRTADKRYRVAYLQAVFPDQSETSKYRLMIMDQDGSNRQSLFPPEGSSGIEPQQVFWSPQVFSDQEYRLALVYQGNLWLVHPNGAQAQQITGDGLITRISWE